MDNHLLHRLTDVYMVDTFNISNYIIIIVETDLKEYTLITHIRLTHMSSTCRRYV